MNYSIYITLLFVAVLSVDVRSQSIDSSNYEIAKAAYKNEAYTRAVKYYQLAYQDAIKVQDSSGASVNLNGTGISYKKLGQYDSAIYFYLKAAALDSLSGDEQQLYSRYRNLGVAYKNKGEYTVAVEFFNKALEISSKMRSAKRTAGVTNSIGNVFLAMERPEDAISSFNNSLDIYRREGNKKQIGTVLNNIAGVYLDLGQLDSAIVLLRESYAIKLQQDDRGSLSYTLHNLGRAFLFNEQLDSAKYYLEKAYKIRQQLNDQAGVAYTANELATYYLQQDSLLEAARYLRESLKYGQEQKNQRFREKNLQILAEVEFQSKNYEEAYLLIKQWAAANDSIVIQVLDAATLKNDFDVAQLESLRQASEKEASDQRLINENERLISRISIIGLCIVLLAAIFLWIQQRRIKKLNQMLHTLNKDIRHRKHNDYQRLLRELEKTEFPATDTFRNMLYASVAVDEALYDAGEEMIQSQTYFAQIIEELKQALNLGDKVTVHMALENYRMSANKATKTAYILSELLTNSVKHNTLEGQTLEVSIKTQINESEFVAIYSDNGNPVDSERLEQSKGLGWKLMNGFTRQLGGTINFARIAGQNTFTLAYKRELQTKWI